MKNKLTFQDLDRYPIVKIPIEITNSFVAKFPIKQKRVKPKYGLLSLVLFIGSFILFLLSLQKGFHNYTQFDLMMFFLIFLVVYFLAIFLPVYNNYKKKLYLYEVTERQHLDSIKQSQDMKYVNEYRQLLVEQLLKDNTPPVKYDYRNNRIGTTEPFFYDYLNKYFNDCIYLNYTINLNGKLNVYMPDFTYYDKEIGLLIDIEIDEPYTAVKDEKGEIAYQSCHTIADKSEKKRDQFFLKSKWVVIRFAEEQIVKQPISCCKVIAEVVELITKKNVPKDLQTENELIKINRWTKDRTLGMFYEDYRNEYLRSIYPKLILKNK